MSITVALDAGHGKDTYQRTGGKGVKYDNGKVFEEHTFNAAVVKYTKEYLERCGIDVVLTQPLNQLEVPLRARTDLANSLKVDLLVSFHADANTNPDTKGHWVFYWHTSEKGKKLAQIWDKYANNIMGNPCRSIQQSKPNTWTDFHMVRETKMPAILIEHAFMTNKEELQRLLSDDFRRKCAETAAKTICEYVGVPFNHGVSLNDNQQNNDLEKIEIANKVKNQVDYLLGLTDKSVGEKAWALKLLVDMYGFMKSKNYI